MQNTQTNTAAVSLQTIWARRVIAGLAGVVLVALGAQAAIPLPGNPVPVTLQVPAVLIVGGLLGPRIGAAALVGYLMIGALGAPVFAPMGAPGVARLIGPTGGYLLAYPLAAATMGLMASRAGVGRLVMGLLLGLVIIHAGGVAQLAALTGDVTTAVQFGSLPFLSGAIFKLAFAGLIVGRFGDRVRGLL